MSRISSRLGLVSALTVFTLSGCQLITQQPTLSSQQLESGQQASPSNQFSLQGKIGVRTPEQSGSAYYTWVQNQADFNIQLNGILGMGKTIIEAQDGKVSLNSAKTGLITAESPEELLEQATGWVAPITALVDWVQARPATPQAKIEKDAVQRISQIVEEGWTVDLSYQDDAQLPNKLVLVQQLSADQQNRVTLLIQNR